MQQNLLFRVGQTVKHIIHQTCFIVNKKLYELFGNSSRIFIQNGFIDYYDRSVRRSYSLINGKAELHREDGPAKEWVNGHTEYWINGQHITQLDDKKIYGKENLAKYLTLV